MCKSPGIAAEGKRSSSVSEQRRSIDVYGEALRVDVMALACGVVAQALGWDSVGVGESGGEGVHGLIAKCGD